MENTIDIDLAKKLGFDFLLNEIETKNSIFYRIGRNSDFKPIYYLCDPDCYLPTNEFFYDFSCGGFKESYRVHEALGFPVLKNEQENWVVGYIAGFSGNTPKAKIILEKLKENNRIIRLVIFSEEILLKLKYLLKQ